MDIKTNSITAGDPIDTLLTTLGHRVENLAARAELAEQGHTDHKLIIAMLAINMIIVSMTAIYMVIAR